MSQTVKKPVTITLSENDWKTITHVVETACRSWSSEWIRWAQTIGRAGETSSYFKDVSIRLSEDDWIVIVGLIEATCGKWGDDRIMWADNMSETIDRALEAARSRWLPMATQTERMSFDFEDEEKKFLILPLGILDTIKHENLVIVEIRSEIGLLIRMKPFRRRPFTDWSGRLSLLIDRRAIKVTYEAPQDLKTAKRVADTLQSFLLTQSYPTDRERIIDYAKQYLEGLTEDQRALFLKFLDDWVQREEMIIELTEQVDEEPLNPNAHFELAEAMLGIRRDKDAEEHFLKALALKSGDSLLIGRANLSLGHIGRYRSDWDMARYRYQQAIQTIENYLRTNVNDSKGWGTLAVAYYNLSYVYDRPATRAKAEEAAARAKLLSAASAQEGAHEIIPADKDKTGLAFEEKCLRIIRAMGFQAQTTRHTGDGGIDIIATSTQPLLRGQYVIQCKDWSNPVGEPPLRDLYGVVVSIRANKGILITSSTFSKAAQLFAQDKQLELIDGEQLDKLYREYVESPS